MMRVDDETRDRVLQVAVTDFGGVTVDTAIRRLLDEHWERVAIEKADRLHATDPQAATADLIHDDVDIATDLDEWAA